MTKQTTIVVTGSLRVKHYQNEKLLFGAYTNIKRLWLVCAFEPSDQHLLYVNTFTEFKDSAS